ncbi:MAG: hypothetical protein ABIW83_09565 [Allosphingosinicella sp.]
MGSSSFRGSADGDRLGAGQERFGQAATIGNSLITDAKSVLGRGAGELKVSEGLLTFVALDENNRPRPVKNA